MATIRDIHRSIAKLSFDEALALVMELRQSRLTVKPKSKFVRRSNNAKPKGVKTPKVKRNPLENISKAELLKLLEESLNG